MYLKHEYVTLFTTLAFNILSSLGLFVDVWEYVCVCVYVCLAKCILDSICKMTATVVLCLFEAMVVRPVELILCVHKLQYL